jgi:hypothetical protein
MPSHHHIEIRFVRSDMTRAAEDDILKIVKLGENSVRAIYTEKSGDGMMIDTVMLSYSQLMAYLCRIFLLLSLDCDPFAKVNISVPGYPIVLLRVQTLQQNLQHILELLMSTCQTWPVVGRPTHLPSPAGEPTMERVD